jgi:uncharacterized cupredoxin-like copper-binding protein
MKGRTPALVAVVGLCGALSATACDPTGSPPGTPPISPGTGSQPREVNLIARDWEFVPTRVELVPGETIVLHVINGGLETHEAIIGDAAVQEAWAQAEAAASPGAPGTTPAVSVAPGVAGVRIVVGSGERSDLTWEVPVDAPTVEALLIGCHIPGHWERGMMAEISLPREPSGT